MNAITRLIIAGAVGHCRSRRAHPRCSDPERCRIARSEESGDLLNNGSIDKKPCYPAYEIYGIEKYQ